MILRSSPFDSLAQLVERGSSNVKIPGESPGWSEILCPSPTDLFAHLVERGSSNANVPG